jgi:hypothetical protein
MFRQWLALILISLLGCCTPISIESNQLPSLYNTIIFDIAAVNTGTPDPAALQFMKNRIIEEGIAHRVIFKQRENVGNALPIWGYGDVTNFEKVNRVLYDKNPKDKILIIFISYLNGIYLQGDTANIAGLQYDTTSFAVFRDLTDNEWEGVVLMHELGHLLGIARRENRTSEPVNPDRPNHCNNENCTMYWRAGSQRNRFCETCLKEIQTLIHGGKIKKRQLVAHPN